MILLGAGGHAIEVYNEILKSKMDISSLYFFDNTEIKNKILLGQTILHDIPNNLKSLPFTPATGNPSTRKKLYTLFKENGFNAINIISSTADISSLEVKLEDGINVMHRVFIGPQVKIGKGSLINAGSYVHHQSSIGNFCEICPGVHISGNCEIEDEVFIGTGAVILPGITVGKGSVIAAGAVVVKNIPPYQQVKGIPAK
jgi:sugar O-acyltransferase (sialic acid O-acetyltransferase NeuD family)